ncbi:MAG: iron-containing alcohol dehydrogenase [Candidatus Limnocylindrales bacterium]
MSDPVPAFGLGRLPRITFGAGVFGEVPAIVARHGSRAFLVTGGRSFNASVRRAQLEAGLAEAGVSLVGSTAVSGEPGPTDVESPVTEFRGRGIEVVIGVGGGAAIDTAKAIAGLLPVETELMDHLEGVGRGVPYAGRALPVVAVPTTAGTGSEATRNAVITSRGPDGYKRSFRDESMVPADAVVDPDLLATAPRSLIAANGLDALTQLLEAMTSQRATPVTDALGRDGLAAIRRGLLAWHGDPDGPDAPAARSEMAYAALLSGICLANAGLGAVHGFASPLGAQLPIPHGMACGAVLWQTIRTNITALTERMPDSPALAKYAQAGRILADLPSTARDGAARVALVDTLHDMVQALDVPRLSAFEMTAAHIPAVVADSPGSSMRTNPVALTDAELSSILEQAL